MTKLIGHAETKKFKFDEEFHNGYSFLDFTDYLLNNLTELKEVVEVLQSKGYEELFFDGWDGSIMTKSSSKREK